MKPFLTLLALGALGTASSQAEEAKLTAADAAESDEFGMAVSLFDDTVVVGSPGDDDVLLDPGSAHVFVRSGSAWSLQAKLTAADAAPHDEFGSAVSISGDTICVGAPGDNVQGIADAGSAYVFVRDGTTWSQQAKLVSGSIGPLKSLFGTSVAVSGDTVVVGTNLNYGPIGGAISGSAFVFVRDGTTWSQQAKLKPGDAGGSDNFGFAVSISDDTAVVGRPQDDDYATGSVYVFLREGTTWTEQAKLSRCNGLPVVLEPEDDEEGYRVTVRRSTFE